MYIEKNSETERRYIELIENHWKSYKVVGRLGDGGNGIVYQLKKRNGVGHDCAIKLEESFDRKHSQRIEKEIKLQEKFGDNPDVVTIHDSDTVTIDGGKKLHLILQELMEGSVGKLLRESSRERKGRAGRLETTEAVRIVIRMCMALESMERRAREYITHGDIKPDNILYKTENGKRLYKLSDFGCASEGEETNSTWLGTEKYAVPGDWHSTRDIYALGISLMEMLGADCPTNSEKYDDVPLWSNLTEEQNEEIPNGLIEIARKAASLKPKDRYQKPAELETDLQHWLQDYEKKEKERKQYLDQVKELINRAEDTNGIAVLEDHLVKIKELLTLLGKGRSDKEREELENFQEAYRRLKLEAELRASRAVYEEAGRLLRSADYHDWLKAVKLYASISRFQDSAAKIAEIVDQVALETDKAVSETTFYFEGQLTDSNNRLISEKEQYREKVEAITKERDQAISDAAASRTNELLAIERAKSAEKRADDAEARESAAVKNANQSNRIENDYKKQINQLKNAHSNELTKLVKDHSNEITKLAKNHSNEITKLTKAHSNELAELTNAHSNELTKLTNNHNIENKKHQEKLQSLSKTIADRDQTIKSLRSRLEEMAGYKETVMAIEAEKAEQMQKELERDLRKKFHAGDIVPFGNYAQGNPAGTGIRWKVLTVLKDRMLVVSESVLASRKFYGSIAPKTWDESDIRKWLNNEFLNEAFSEEEKKAILLTSLNPVRNKAHGTDGGKATDDQVFLLSMDDVTKYMSSDAARQCKSCMSVRTQVLSNGAGFCKWSLRTPGVDKSYAAYVDFNGKISSYGTYVNSPKYGIRPAMWINPENE